tara:strand:- start:313 stop:2406 length:2094 start_codon:yes stop_codon:yes gene_type:complete
MNNPFNRRMFRQVGMSKQPMGILASSPELMTTAEKAMMRGQPVRAQDGTVVRVDRNRLQEYQNPNTEKGLQQNLLNALSGKSSFKYSNAFPSKPSDSPLGVGIKSVGNLLNRSLPYITDNLLAAGKYLGKSRDYELSEEQLAKKIASENAGTPVKITDGKLGITKDIPQDYKGSTMDDRLETVGIDSGIFKSGMEKIKEQRLADYKTGAGEKLAKVKSGEVTNTDVKSSDKTKKSEKVGGDTFTGTGKLSDKRSDELSLVTKDIFAEHRAIEKQEGMTLPLKLSTIGKGMQKKALEILNDKDISDDEKAGTVFEILKGKKANPKTIKKDIKSMLEDMSGTKPGITTTAGYNLMMTGLLIAAGDSPNALTNIARGAAQGLQGYGKALEKERAKESEMDLLAGKLAVGEFLEQEKESRKKSDFVFSEDFTDQDGKVYKAGDAVKATDEQLIALQQAGIRLKDKDSYNNYQKLQTALAKKKLTGGIKVDSKVLNTDLAFFAESPSALQNQNIAVTNLENQIMQITNPDQKIVGGKALLNSLIVKAKAAMGMEISDDQLQGTKFTTDVDNALIAFAVSLLGEGGKTISNEERKMLYQSLKGFYDEKGAVTKDPKSVAYKLQTLRNRIAEMSATRERELAAKMQKYNGVFIEGTNQPVSNLIQSSLNINKPKAEKKAEKKSTLEKTIKIEPITILNKTGEDE